MLKIIFKKIFIRFFKKKPYFEIDLAVKDISSNKKKSNLLKKKYLKYKILKKNIFRFNKKKIAELGFLHLIFLTKFFFSQGQLELAYHLRENLKKKTLNIDSKDQLFLKIKFLIELNKLKKAKDEIKKNLFKINNLINFLHDLNVIKFIDRILKKKQQNFLNLNPIVNEIKEKNFEKSINKKNIIIIGPGHPQKLMGKIIDNYDVVIRFNQFKEINLPQARYVGRKTDIIYLNGNMTKKITEKDLDEFFLNKWICSRLNFSSLEKLKNFRSTRKLFINPIGAYGFLQDVLIDILHFNPKSIHIINSNFGLGKKIYAKEYSKPNKINNKKMYLTQSKLDFLSSINFMKVLKKNNIIKVDQELNNLLKLNSINLLKKFKSNFSMNKVLKK